jgi:hypothetical protein
VERWRRKVLLPNNLEGLALGRGRSGDLRWEIFEDRARQTY